MASYLRPRRGKKATAIAQLTASAPLKRGEVFFEVPDAGTGTGAGKIKMGDGSTAYESLPYFLEPFDPNSATVGFTDATEAEADPYTSNATHTNAIVPAANFKTIFTNLKQLLLNYNSQFTKLNNDLTQSIDSIQSQIVPTESIESGATASKAYSVGDFLVKDEILYKVTNAITEGDVLTVGANIELDTVASELSSISERPSDDIDRVTQDGVVLTSPYTCTRKRECIRVEVTIGYTEGKNSGGEIFVNGHLAVKHACSYLGTTVSLQTLIYLYEGDVLTFSRIGNGRANAWRVSGD